MYNLPRQATFTTKYCLPQATVTCTSATATLWGLQRSKFQGIQQLTAMDVQAKMVRSARGRTLPRTPTLALSLTLSLISNPR